MAAERPIKRLARALASVRTSCNDSTSWISAARLVLLATGVAPFTVVAPLVTWAPLRWPFGRGGSGVGDRAFGMAAGRGTDPDDAGVDSMRMTLSLGSVPIRGSRAGTHRRAGCPDTRSARPRR